LFERGMIGMRTRAPCVALCHIVGWAAYSIERVFASMHVVIID
jgi:hypothetical protein